MSTINFMRDSVQSYARSALPFARDAHQLVERLKTQSESTHEDVLKSLQELDDLYNAMTLNHVARRASKTQGVALLTLYSRGFTRPAYLGAVDESEGRSEPRRRVGLLIDTLKASIRKGDVQGHLPICWGVLTSSIELGVGKSKDAIKTP